ncbi:endonuclease VII domain-containing protein [Klenkia marina]|uniref:endonuclease VII domain-containing protein n=1 Tax=Klenkia marina TaxID=1960309 RepID=UPI001FB24DCC|nr:endonuclease VII domain-containing protein [Klenkia marina]
MEVPAGEKWCPDCATVKPLDQFLTTPRSRTGRHTYCKPCHNARGRASLEKVGGARTYHLKRRYGISAADAEVMLREQGGVCAICRTAQAAHVDHDHVTGVVRELLCFNCNGGLGQFRDDPAVLLAAVAYLEKHGSGPVPVDGAPTAGCAAAARLGSDRRDRRGTRPGRRSTDRPAPGSVDQHGAGPDGPAEEAHG